MDLGLTLRQAATGDAQAWRALVEAYSGRVFGLIVHHCGDRDLAEEITQATFVKVVTSLSDYVEQGRFESWLFRIAVNQLRDEIRRRKRQAQPMDMGPGGGDDDAPASAHAWEAVQSKIVRVNGDGDAESPLDRMTRGEQVDLLRQAVAAMGERDREILHLRHTAGLSFAEIAQALDEPLGTVLARGHRALAKLRKLLEGDSDSPAKAAR